MSPSTFELYTNPLETGIHAIEASAGTGKTYTLSQLVVRLVVEKAIPIEQLLTVTFTRAAAAELRARIFERLSEVLKALEGKASDDAPLQAWIDTLDPQAAKSTILKARMMLDQAPIYTIDAFAMQVAREYALALGLPWDADLLEDDQRLKQQLVDQLWHQLPTLPDTLRQGVLDTYTSPDDLYERFRALGTQATFPLHPTWQTLLARQEAIQQKWPANKLQDISTAIDDYFRQGGNKNKLGKCDRMILTPLKAGELPKMEGKETLVAYLQGALTKKAPYEKLPETARQQLDKLDADIRTLPKIDDLVHAWFMESYETWKHQLQQRLTQQGLFTYDSLKHQLANAVSEQPKLHQQLQATYQACLIDEFQDTDPDQWQLFHQLFGTPPHRLFLIGDPKQAIYSFRGANLLTYFQATQQADFHHTLDTNFRSHPQLVEGFNALFEELDPEHPTFLDARCAYQPLHSAKSAEETAFTLNDLPQEKIRIVQGEELDDANEETLTQLARDVVQVLQGGKRMEKVKDSECDATLQPRAIQPGEIAVLVKSNDDAQAVQKALRRVNVPSVLTSRTSVWHSDSALLMIQLIQTLLNPRQRQSLRGVLASPYFQYTLEQLNEETRFNQAQQLFSEALQRWEQAGILAALLTLFDATNSWAKLAHLPDGDRRIADTRHLLELLHSEAHQSDRSPPALLRWAEQQYTQATSGGQTLRLERDDEAIEIVTMHSAKGLEYPVVFVYGAWRQDSVGKSAFPIALPTENGVKGSFKKEDKDQLQAQARQELRRLFYVACTRAVSHLTLYWPNADQEEKAYYDAINGILRPRLKQLQNHPSFVFATYEATPPTQWTPPLTTPSLVAPPAVPFADIKARSRILTSYSGLTRFNTHHDTPFERWLEEGEETPLVKQDNLPAGAAFGKLVHDFLEVTDFSQPNWQHLAHKWQRFKPTDPALPEALQQLIEQTLEGNCQPFRLADLPPASTHKEHHFVLHTPNMDLKQLNQVMAERADWQTVTPTHVHGYLQGYIDLIVEFEGKYYVLDYKTNRLADYSQPALIQAMKAHRYTLQALLYTLALDAYLRTFKADYDPAQHLGGVRYLFMRGMQAASPQGVYAFNFTPEQLLQARSALMGEAS